MERLRLRRTAAALLIAAAGAAALAGPAGAASCRNANVLPQSSGQISDARASVLCLVNKERTSRSLKALKRHSLLQKVGMSFARDMVDRQFFDHTAPGGGTFSKRLASFDWSGSSAGENIAYGSGSLGTPANIVKAWMKSPGHRRNILQKTFTRAGVGIANGAPEDIDQAAATYSMEYDRP